MPGRPVTPPSLRERIGGRWAVSWQEGAVAAVGVLLNSYVAATGMRVTPLASTSFDPLGLLLQAAAVCGVLALFAVTVFRHRAIRPVPIWAVAVMGGIAGVARVAVEYARGPGVPEGFSTFQEAMLVIVPFVSSGLIAVGISFVGGTRQWYVEERERLLRLEVEEEARRLRSIGALDALEAIARQSAESDLADASAGARRALGDRGDDGDARAAADALLVAARDGARPAGRTLADRPADRAYPRVSVSRVAATELHRHPLPMLIPAIVMCLVATPRLSSAEGALNALASSAVIVVGIVVAFSAGRWLIRRLPRLALPITLVACAAAAAPVPATQALVFVESVNVGQAVAVLAFFLFASVAVVSFALTAASSGAEVLEALRRPLAQSELERLAAERAQEQILRELGLQLHTSVQPRLVAASYAIQDALARGDKRALEEAIEEARAALDRRLEPTRSEAPEDVVADVDAEWHGILRLTWEPADLPAAAQTNAVRAVLRECLANALVHGRATRATIRITHAGDALEVVVADDGVGPRPGPPGLGSAVLGEHAPGWRLERGRDGGAVVRAHVPL